MVRGLLDELHRDFTSFRGTGSVMVLFAAALIVLYLLYSKRKQGTGAVGISVLAAISFVMAAAIDHALSLKTDRRLYRGGAAVFTAVLCLFTAVYSGSAVYLQGDFERAGNEMHIPDDMAEAASFIVKDADHPTVLVMPGYGPYFESFSSAYDLAYEEPYDGDLSHLGEDEWLIYTHLSTVHPVMRKVSNAAKRLGCDYVVLSDDIWPEIAITKCGYETVLELDTCSVYREVNAP